MITVQIDPNSLKTPQIYPWIGIHSEKGINDTVVLFTSEKSGVCLVTNETCKFGVYSTGWIEKNFRPFTGVLNISNRS